MIHKFLYKMKQIGSCESGVALIEFALVVPILMLFFIVGTELSRAVIITGQNQQTADATADSVSQVNTIYVKTPAQFTTYMSYIYTGAQSMIGKNSFENYKDSVVMISDYANPPSGSGVALNWRCESVVDASFGAAPTSRITIGTSGGIPAIFVNGTAVPMPAGFEFIVSESYYSFYPLLTSNFVQPYTFYSAAYYQLITDNTATGLAPLVPAGGISNGTFTCATP